MCCAQRAKKALIAHAGNEGDGVALDTDDHYTVREAEARALRKYEFSHPQFNPFTPGFLKWNFPSLNLDTPIVAN